VSEHTHPAAHRPGLPSLRLIEWIPSSRDGGMLRVRGELGDPVRATAGAPVLALRDGDGVRTLAPALGDDSSNGDGWRAAYLVATRVIDAADALWLEWPDGARIPLPAVDVTHGHVLGQSAAPPRAEAEVFDRAVLAERRAQRAENAQKAQARAATEAMAALGALERRVEELTRERDALAARPAPVDGALMRLVPAREDGSPPPDGLREELEAARERHREAEARERSQSAALDEALSALGRLRLQASHLRLKLRTQVASASADSVRLAVLESEDRGFRARLRAARAELEGLRGRMAAERQERERLVADLDSERAVGHRAQRERDELRDALAAKRAARVRIESELELRRAEVARSGTEAERLSAEMSAERHRASTELARLRSRIEDVGQLLRAERAARASLAMDLRVARSRAGAARAEAAVAAAQRATLRAEFTAAVEELRVTRKALADAQERLRGAAAAAGEWAPPRTAPAPSRTPEVTVDPPAHGPAGELQERIDELQRTAGGDGWQRRASAHAPAAIAPPSDAAGVAARLDAAAASLRAKVAPDPVGVTTSRAAPGDTAAPARIDASPAPAASALVRTSAAITDRRQPAAPPIAGGTRRLRSLRGALVRLAVEDPFAAARLLGGLLPAQGAFLAGDVDYDLTIRELGTFAITVAGGNTSVRVLRKPRSRRDAELHITLHALTLAELLAGRSRRVGRVLAPVKVRGSRRKLAMLGELAVTRARLRDLAQAGARLDPALLIRALPFAIDARDTDGHQFTIAQEIIEGAPRTWFVSVAGRRGLSVSDTEPEPRADARVSVTRETFDRLLRGERPDRAQKPWIRGDFAAVDRLRGWIEAALA